MKNFRLFLAPVLLALACGPAGAQDKSKAEAARKAPPQREETFTERLNRKNADEARAHEERFPKGPKPMSEKPPAKKL